MAEVQGMAIEGKRVPALNGETFEATQVVFIDNTDCWVLGQSVKDAAVSKPAYFSAVESVTDMQGLSSRQGGPAQVIACRPICPALIDRVVHHAEIITIEGQSYRRRRFKFRRLCMSGDNPVTLQPATACRGVATVRRTNFAMGGWEPCRGDPRS